MALNLWKIGGQPTSFNPLPTGFNNKVISGIGDFFVTIKAKSATSAVLRVAAGSSSNLKIDGAGPIEYALTPELKIYTHSVKGTMSDLLYLVDKNNTGNIIIDSIELVQKSLPKLTINGIDGFTSGKWSLAPQATVIDDETLVLNATANGQPTRQYVNVQPNTNYTVFFQGTGRLYLYEFKNGVFNNVSVKSDMTEGSFSFKTSNNVDQIEYTFSNGSLGAGQFTFKRPMLNLGTIPAPYSKKTGDKMVLPIAKKNLFDGMLESGTYNNSGDKSVNASLIRSVNKIPVKPNKSYVINTVQGNLFVKGYGVSGSFVANNINGVPTSYTFTTPSDVYYVTFATDNANAVNVQLEEGTTATPYTPYAVQLNPKPKRYVPKKNLFDKSGVTAGQYIVQNGSTFASGVTSLTNYIAVKPNTDYITSNFRIDGVVAIVYYDSSKTFISGEANKSQFKTPSNCSFVRANVYTVDLDKAQLEEGSTQTPYEPYQLVLPKAKTGLAFNGVTDYLQLPSMTMDSVEIDCLVDKSGGTGSKFLIDARIGSPSGHFNLSGSGNDISSVLVNGATIVKSSPDSYIPDKQRIKVKVIYNNPFTDDVVIFNRYDGIGGQLKGTIYKVTCYLNGGIVAQYDFENPSNIVGNQVLQNAKNLIPSFEDARWSLHANTQVLGKDVLRLNASGSQQNTDIRIDTKPNTTYRKDLFSTKFSNCLVYDSLGNMIQDNGGTEITRTFTTPSNASYLIYRLSNHNFGAGSFDFIKPQLYQLDGKEGTIVGNPVRLNKASKRTLYSKR